MLLIDNSFGTAVTDIGLTYHELKQQDTTIDKLNLTGQIGEKTLQTLDLLTDLTYESQKTLPKPIANPTRHALNFAIIKQQSKFPPYLKVISAVAIFAIVLSFVIDGLRIYHYQKATLQTKEQIKLQYSQWFPNETFNNRLNIERLLSGKLINQTGDTTGSNVLTVMTSIQPVLQQHQITAKQLNFQNNQLQLQLIAQNNDSLNQAINALNTQGIQAKLGTITPSEQGGVGGGRDYIGLRIFMKKMQPSLDITPMTQKFAQLPRRDQMALLGLAVFLVLFVFGFGGWELATKKPNTAQKKL